MMKISVSDAGKRFNRDWIFRRFNYTFAANAAYAIIGPNGSGKSTLLQVLAGAVTASEGTITYEVSGKQVPSDDVYKQLSIAAPYLELIEEMSVTELLHFHQKFKPFLPGMNIDQIISTVGLSGAADKQIRFYSSGMKQRVKLAQAIFSDTPLLLLDEPCTNLDSEGIHLYRSLIENYTEGKTIVVSSNDLQEFEFCSERISILDYK